jgi:hypothetical protein
MDPRHIGRKSRHWSARFFGTVLAPNGFGPVGPHLGSVLIPLELWVSGYNGKTILRLANRSSENIEWDMDSSDTDTFTVTGSIVGSVEEQCAALHSLSSALRSAGLAHEVLADVTDTGGSRTVRWQFDWPHSVQPVDLEDWPHRWYGWWQEYGPDYRRCPSIHSCVRPDLTANYDKARLRQYLESATSVAVTSRASFPHPFKGKRLDGSICVMTDGGWQWLSDLPECIVEYDVAIPAAWLRDIMARAYLPLPVDPSEFAGLDGPPAE